jgi:hypothetical protein
VKLSHGFGSSLKHFSTPANENKDFATTFACETAQTKILKQNFPVVVKSPVNT